ncbi:MAG: hypothetical protein ONB46_23920 [candidate division KSB1 bacterium]|nr:hypothetical protein [candidate division KSB1 bacterium]MDZ7368914.1 hypothetical protein [candidate division KSB1 bacterium]MDZ7406902.1 hypothetical protein [candidate division KSB1 bacterium]
MPHKYFTGHRPKNFLSSIRDDPESTVQTGNHRPFQQVPAFEFSWSDLGDLTLVLTIQYAELVKGIYVYPPAGEKRCPRELPIEEQESIK